MLQNGSHFRHFHHKGGLAGSQVIAGADTGEHSVHNAQSCAASRDERAHLRHQHDQCHLPHVGGFTGHVRAGDDGHLVVLAAKECVVGHKEGIFEHHFHHGMASIGNGNFVTQGHFRTAVATLQCHSGQAAQGVCGCHSGGCNLHAGGLLGQIFPQFGENLVFQRSQPILGGEHLGFQILQFLGDVALAVCQRLLANIVTGHLIHEGFGYLDVIAKYPVESNLQGADAGGFLFSSLNGGNGAGAAIHQLPQGIGIGICTLADDAAFPNGQRGIFYDGVLNERSAVFHGVHGFCQFLQHGCIHTAENSLCLWKGTQTLGKTQ